MTLNRVFSMPYLTVIINFRPVKRYEPLTAVGRWCAQDTLVLKAISLVLIQKVSLRLSDDCYHLAGKGLKACVRKVKKDASHYRYVCRSDVNSYYATMDHDLLMLQLRELIPDSALLALIEQLLARLDDVNGELHTVTTGINKGSPLSPLLCAIYILQMDKALGGYCAKHDLKYYQRPQLIKRWMIGLSFILCKTKNQLRTAVKLMNQCLEDVKQTKHPFKTYIGRIKHDGFDFLGYRIKASAEQALDVAWKTWARHMDVVNADFAGAKNLQTTSPNFSRFMSKVCLNRASRFIYQKKRDTLVNLGTQWCDHRPQASDTRRAKQ